MIFVNCNTAEWKCVTREETVRGFCTNCSGSGLTLNMQAPHLFDVLLNKDKKRPKKSQLTDKECDLLPFHYTRKDREGVPSIRKYLK